MFFEYVTSLILVTVLVLRLARRHNGTVTRRRDNAVSKNKHKVYSQNDVLPEINNHYLHNQVRLNGYMAHQIVGGLVKIDGALHQGRTNLGNFTVTGGSLLLPNAASSDLEMLA